MSVIRQFDSVVFSISICCTAPLMSTCIYRELLDCVLYGFFVLSWLILRSPCICADIAVLVLPVDDTAISCGGIWAALHYVVKHLTTWGVYYKMVCVRTIEILFSCYWPFVRGIHRSSVNSPHKGQWHGALMFSLICAWMNGWANTRDAVDLRRHHAHYDITVMYDYNLAVNSWSCACHDSWAVMPCAKLCPDMIIISQVKATCIITVMGLSSQLKLTWWLSARLQYLHC